ncbi:MAG: OsmC family peroxiredoxin [Bryobacterales bacterium]|nr:OsmC family peroxiredoxin [Bryobacterales bacterium]
MVILRSAEATWAGTVSDGSGRIQLQSGALDAPFSLKARAADGPGTNPEELIAGAHAGCYSMMLSALLTGLGKPASSIHTKARVQLEKLEAGFTITKIILATEASVPGLTAAEFAQAAEDAKKNCPVSRALAAVPVEFTATLLP